MVKNVHQCLQVQDDILKCLVLSTTQTYSAHCQRGGKNPENIHIVESEIREIWTFLLLKLINQLHILWFYVLTTIVDILKFFFEMYRPMWHPVFCL